MILQPVKSLPKIQEKKDKKVKLSKTLKALLKLMQWIIQIF